MLRSLPTWLLLLNYLLVVGAGLLVSRPPEPLFTAAHPYVHGQDCQQKHYLRLDCFEHCNGDRPAARPRRPTGTGLHYLAQLKGLDVHCPAATLAALAAPMRRGRTARLPAAAARRLWRVRLPPAPTRLMPAPDGRPVAAVPPRSPPALGVVL